ncbi:phage minor tail protein [Escherichia coli]|uniref:Phage minor tail protein n=1 Tax=Escherichia coli TaxID=562 RepID=A0A376U839_ECOLX|nr:phage minor tail protein [Escherichia coli]
MVAGMSCSVWSGKPLPIDVVKIPMAAPLKQAFDENVDRIRRERLPGELAYALKHN